MTPATARAALSALVTAATGIPASAVFWRRRPMGWAPEQHAILRLTSYASHGRDEVYYDYSALRPLGAELVPHEVGLRKLTWQIQLWSHDTGDTLDALSLAMAVRDRLHLDEHRDALAAAGLGVADVLAMTDLDVDQDDREMSVAQLDVALNAETDVAGTALGYVEHWGIEGEADLIDGSTETIINGVFP